MAVPKRSTSFSEGGSGDVTDAELNSALAAKEAVGVAQGLVEALPVLTADQGIFVDTTTDPTEARVGARSLLITSGAAVTGTTAETNAAGPITVPGITIAQRHNIPFIFGGATTNNTGADRTITFRVRFGSAVATMTFTLPTSATARNWQVTGVILTGELAGSPAYSVSARCAVGAAGAGLDSGTVTGMGTSWPASGTDLRLSVQHANSGQTTTSSVNFASHLIAS